MRPVTPGDPIGPALTADWYNHTLKPSPENLAATKRPIRHNDIIFAKNVSGEVIPVYEPVVITDLITPRPGKIIVEVDKPVSDSAPFAVTLKQFAVNGSGKIQVDGVALANISDVPALEETYVETTIAGALRPATAGPARLLFYNASGPSIVSLNATPVVEPIDFELLEDLENGSALADISNKSGTLIATSVIIEDTQDIFDLPAGSKGIGIRMNNRYYIYNASCP